MTRASSLSVLLLLGLGATACASSPAVGAAERGDVASLRAQVAAREKSGALSNAEAARIARAVVAWDLGHAKGDEDARARVREVRACAAEVDDALAHRAQTHDAPGGEAALARADARTLSASDARDSAGDAIDAWRAVGARGLVRDDDRAARAQALLDPAPLVRRAAMHAAIDARDPSDVGTLAEAARSDPEPLLRSDAARALGVIGGDAAFRALRDLWASADDPMREDIARAYASPSIRDAGGKGELGVVLSEGRGPGAIEAAGAVLRGAARDSELDAVASALLLRTIETGSDRSRLHAVALVPVLPGPFLDALRAASTDPSPSIRVAALARLTETATDRAASITALEGLATDAGQPAVASRAKLALASAGDARVQAWLEADLTAPRDYARLGAASALAALHREGRAAPLLADDEASVREQAACVILMAARTRR